MSITYQYSTDDGANWTDLGTAGYGGVVRVRNNADVDMVSFQKIGPTALTDADPFTYDSDIWIRTWDGVTGTLWFRGKVSTIPRYGTALSEVQNVTIDGPWRDLERCAYQQTWKIWSTSSSSVENANKTRVVLYQNAAGDRITTGAQIEDAIDWAISRGVALQKGTIDAGPYLPYDEKENLSCAEVIHAVIRLIPDFVASIDYSTNPPTFNCRQRANLSAASKAITDGELLDITPLHNRKVSGIHLTYEQTINEDGEVYKKSTIDTAGSTTAIDTVYMTFDLEGESRTYVRQKVITADFPGSLDDKAFFKSMAPAYANIDDADITFAESTTKVVSGTSTPSTLPRYVVAGQIPEWLSVSEELVTVTFKVFTTTKDSEDDPVYSGIDEIKVELRATNASTRTYKRLTSFDEGEPVPSGVAAALYAAWNTLEYQGSFQFTLEDCPGTIGPGNKFNLTSGMTAWASMNALVVTCTEYVDEGRTVINFGPPQQLEADTLLGIFRGARSRRFSWSRLTRTTGVAGGGSDVEMGGGTAQKNTSSKPKSYERILVKKNDGTNDQTVDIDPSQVLFADAGYAAAQVIKPREMIIPFIDAADSDKLKAKLTQVMASAPYGEEQPIPLGLPTDPATPATVGDTDEGAEAADTTTYTAAATGLQLHCMTRVAYYDAGDEKLYGYIRTLKFDQHGRLSSVSAETRIEIDVPEL